MALTAEQIKGRIKNTAKKNGADARILLRIYMMERFLERIANSRYAGNFIIKGGILVTSMVGLAMRSTMDIDTTIRNLNLSEEDVLLVISEISKIDLQDDIVFEIEEVSHIMDEMEYPGIRIMLNASLGGMVIPMKIDVSTGDIITPHAIEYQYKLMLEDRAIRLWSYNLETVLAEKLQTVLARGILNTRMRDFYDISVLMSLYKTRVNAVVLKDAFYATCRRRETETFTENGHVILSRISENPTIANLWKAYQKKYSYAREYSFETVMESSNQLYKLVTGIEQR